jgi:hypothetical protein
MPGCELSIMGIAGFGALKRRLLSVYWSQLTAAQLDAVDRYGRQYNPKSPRERLWCFSRRTLERTGGIIPELADLI